MENTIIKNKERTLLGYNLNQRENVISNHLTPSILACILFIFIIATDISVIFRHYKDDDPIWASLTLFFMYLPAIGSFIIIVTDWDNWPEPENGMTKDNMFWLCKKTLGHLLFPFWNMWRFAERIFWSIEAATTNNEEDTNEAILMATETRLIELYVFLQSYLHSLPQVILQLHILMRHNSDIARESKNIQALCIILNLAKVAVTTTYYQRFKAQKLTGSHQYPWLKKKKILRSQGSDYNRETVVLRTSNASQKRVIENQTNNLDDISRLYDIQPSLLMERRRSSDIYLEPEPVDESSLPIITDNAQENIEINISEQNYTTSLQGDTSKLRNLVTRSSYVARFSSILGVRNTTVSDSATTDFKIARVEYIKGLEEDDIAGKIISFLWWFTFLLGRVLAISAFAYFFLNACIWLLLSHVILVIVILMYDVKTDNIKRDKIIFFLFIGVVYIFCIIEFKIRFKKTHLIYIGYFGLVFLENFIMCLVWFYGELESIENDYWYRYIFYTIIASDMLSLSSMIFYRILTKPKSVPVRTTSQ